jgi:hypothetical protein
MCTATENKVAPLNALEAATLARILREGYGSGACHGPDLKTAVGDVPSELAFRPIMKSFPQELRYRVVDPCSNILSS